MEKHFWAIEVHAGKMQKFATVSSQICIMWYVQRALLLNTLVCFCSIWRPCFVGNIQNNGQSMSLLQHCFIISCKMHKTTEKAQNISSKSHRLNRLHVLRDWRHVIFISFQLVLIEITRLLRFIIETYQGLSSPFIYTRLGCKYSKGDWSFEVNFSMCLELIKYTKWNEDPARSRKQVVLKNRVRLFEINPTIWPRLKFGLLQTSRFCRSNFK